MPRPLILAVLVAVPLVVAVTVLSLAVVRADQAEAGAARVRLALWRLDAQAGGLLVAEASAAPEAYAAFHGIDAVGGRRVQIASPLLALPQEPVLLHVQIDADGHWSSPQVPDRAHRATALAGHTTPEALAVAEHRLAGLDESARHAGGFAALIATLPPLPARQSQAGDAVVENLRKAKDELQAVPQAAGFAATIEERKEQVRAAEAAPAVAQMPQGQEQVAALAKQDVQTDNDFRQRSLNIQTSQAFNSISNRIGAQRQAAAPDQGSLAMNGVVDKREAEVAAAPPAAAFQAIGSGGMPAGAGPLAVAASAPAAPTAARSAVVAGKTGTKARESWHLTASATAVTSAMEAAEAGPMQAQWLDDHLLLMRRARVDHQLVVQAAVVAWPQLRALLLATIADCLPAADLAPAVAADGPEWRLAALPVRLAPGAIAAITLRPAARWTLIAAWLGTVIGIAGAALLLTMAHRLGERRAAFVSAVTHELRTPLTSMRLHADLLADRRIADDPEKRAGRIAVLRTEAGRLAHLIDNVLDYARLERRRPPAPRPVVLEELVTPLLPRLAERLAAAGLVLASEPLPAASVRCDPAAVERILANLADNAAKYAAEAGDRTVTLRALIADRRLELRLRDRGPGVAADVRARLFVPFARSAEAAAGHAPGVGLGLALCRRMARAQGGDLRLDEPVDGPGTEAVLTLPLSA